MVFLISGREWLFIFYFNKRFVSQQFFLVNATNLRQDKSFWDLANLLHICLNLEVFRL